MFARKNNKTNSPKSNSKIATQTREEPIQIFDPAKSKYSMDNELVGKEKDTGMPDYLNRNPEKSKASNFIGTGNKVQPENPEDVKIAAKEEAERLAQQKSKDV